VTGRSLLLSLCLLLPSLVSAQQACPPIQVPPPDPSKLLFTPKQETELGEIIRQQSDSDFLVIEDPQVTSYLDRIGRQIAQHLPDTGLHYQFVLYDLPEVQAFGAPGGRIYVSRKLVAFLKNEDELAGLLGHEMGHLTVRQQAIDLSRIFRDVLGIKSVSDSDDLFDLYNQFLQSIRLKKRNADSSGNEEKGQAVADLIGVQAVARAGYSPQAFPAFLDRLMQTKGNKGSWLTDMFGATRPDSRRLREALRDVSNLPSACLEPRHQSHSDDFQRWQSAVLHYSGIGHAESLPGFRSRKALNNPLRADIDHFRFSPDGKLLLAQDDSGIYVLTRDPLRFVFRIEAPGAEAAQFSPDSRQVVFFNSHFRVETWDIEHQEQVSLVDVPVLHGCRDSALSPDAKYLACFDGDLTLSLFDVASGDTLFQKQNFYQFESAFNPYMVYFRLLYFLSHPDVVVLRFSPDARYFAASSHTGESVAFDLVNRKKISFPGTIQNLMSYSFTFLGPDRVVGLDKFHPDKSPVAEFPSGKVLDRVPLGDGSLTAAANPNYLLIRPVVDHPVGAYSLAEKKLVYTTRTDATDVWGDFFVSERLNGEIGLYKLGQTNPAAIAQLPLGELGRLAAFATSPDLKFLAISTRTRGGIWNLESNQRIVHVRAFQNASYNPNSSFFLDFPSFQKMGRELVVASPLTGQSKARPVDKDDDLTFFGNVLFRVRHSDKSRSTRRNMDLDALDIVDQKVLWSRHFPKQGPSLTGSISSGEIVLFWPANADGLRDEMASDPRLRALWDSQKPREGDYLLEAVDARSGSLLGAVILRTGKYSFLPESIQAVGDWLVVGDSVNRVLLFSLSTGKQVARWFGYNPEISRDGRRLCLDNGRGHLIVYDLRTFKPIDDLYFTHHVSLHTFSGDGTKLFVLCDDQTAFELDVTAAETKSAAN
jgi:WD40 repeat protein